MQYDNTWEKQIWSKIDLKLQNVALRSNYKLPYTQNCGVHNDMQKTDITWWTNGFWPGLLWLMYANTKKEVYLEAAKTTEIILDEAFKTYDGLHHDVGFMWNISSGLHHALLEDHEAYVRTMMAANILASRFQLKGGYIRAWNDGIEGEKNIGWSIIDCMMNIPLLYKASRLVDDERYANIAMAHADKTMQNHVREDGSVRHIVEYNPNNGDFLKEYAGQGYAVGSSWSRGQAWALYGFGLSYTYTKKQAYLDTAKKVAHYFMANMATNKIPLCDFRSPEEPQIYDSTAGAIAACGLIEISKHVSQENEKDFYISAAKKLLQNLEAMCCDWSADTDMILQNGTERYHSDTGRHIPIIYGDYFFAEAIAKLLFPNFLAW